MDMRNLILVIFFLLIVAGNVHAASFDCGKATSEVEKLICGDKGLSELDESLSKAYREVLRSVPDPADLKQEQVKWLREVRNRCTDSLCLEKAYRSRLAEFERLLSVSKAGEESVAMVAPLRVIKRITDYRPAEYRMPFFDGRLFFSQYDKSGNNYDILALDTENLSSEYILRGRCRAQFIAQNDKYLVVNETERFANPLVVIDRASGKQVGQIGLNDSISWARIKGHRLIAIQRRASHSGHSFEAHALVFDLPSLKIIKSLVIPGVYDVRAWQGRILAVGYDLTAYDDDFNEMFKIALPKPKARGAYGCGERGPLRVYGDKAAILANCGEILIYDLPTRRLERTIPSYAHSYAMAIIDGLIFTSPKTPGGELMQGNSARVHDLYTGKELAVLPINATHLFSMGNRLLAVEYEHYKPSSMTLYAVNTSALRRGQWRVEQVLKKCQEAEALWDESRDLYGAIGICESAGIEGLAEEDGLSKSVLSVTNRYALWLSKTLDRTRDAARLLEVLQRQAPDEEIGRALAEVRLKTRILEGNEVDSLTAEEKQTDFARILDIGNHLKGAETRSINFGAFPDLFHFAGNRIYVGRYREGASIGVLDRKTFEEVASIPIAPDDPEYQDSVASITSDENRIYVSVGYRYEQPGRPNFFVIDKTSLNVVKKALIEAPSTLIFDSGQLLACDCFRNEQGCKAVNPVTTEVVDLPDKICVQAGARGAKTVVRFPIDLAERVRPVVLTRDYLVHSGYKQYTFYPRVNDSKPISVTLKPPNILDGSIGSWGNGILVSEGTRGGILVKMVRVPTGATETLFGLPTSPNVRMSVFLLHNQTLFVGLGRDLLIFDIKSNTLQRYIKNLIPAELKSDRKEFDRYRIDRLMIDQGHLIALTFSGEDSRIVPLSSLVVDR
jgi:uncharacterized protein